MCPPPARVGKPLRWDAWCPASLCLDQSLNTHIPEHPCEVPSGNSCSVVTQSTPVGPAVCSLGSRWAVGSLHTDQHLPQLRRKRAGLGNPHPCIQKAASPLHACVGTHIHAQHICIYHHATGLLQGDTDEEASGSSEGGQRGRAVMDFWYPQTVHSLRPACLQQSRPARMRPAPGTYAIPALTHQRRGPRARDPCIDTQPTRWLPHLPWGSF